MDKDRRANFLRKLHSFAGVFPLGIFLCFHMCVNYSANWGTTPYDTMGSFMAHMPYKVVLETFVIFLPPLLRLHLPHLKRYRETLSLLPQLVLRAATYSWHRHTALCDLAYLWHKATS